MDKPFDFIGHTCGGLGPGERPGFFCHRLQRAAVQAAEHRCAHRLGEPAFEVFDDTPYPTEGLVSLEATKGTVIVLDGRLPHLSGANRSDHSRHAYTLHVVDPAADYPADNWLQRPDLPLRGFRG